MEKREKLRLMQLKALKKRKNPSFRRVESWRYVKVKDNWRKPRGIDNKSRKHKKSGVKLPDPGYRTPKKVRNLHPSGLKDVLVSSIKELDNLSPKIHGIRVNRRLGGRKRIQLIEAAVARGFKVFNIGLEMHEEFSEFGEELKEAEEEFEGEEESETLEDESENNESDEEETQED